MDEYSAVINLVVEIGDNSKRVSEPDSSTLRLSTALPKHIRMAEVVHKVQDERPLWQPVVIVRYILAALQNPNKVECVSFQHFHFDGLGLVEQAIADTLFQQWPTCGVRILDFRMSSGLRSKKFAVVHEAVRDLKRFVCYVPDIVARRLASNSNVVLQNTSQPKKLVVHTGVGDSSLSLMKSGPQNIAQAKNLFASHNISLQFLVDMKENRKLDRFIENLRVDSQTQSQGNDLFNAKDILERDPSVRAQLDETHPSKRLREERTGMSLEDSEVILKKYKFLPERVYVPRDRMGMEDYASMLDYREMRKEANELRDAIRVILQDGYTFVSYRNPPSASRLSHQPQLSPVVTDESLRCWAHSMWTGYTIEDVLQSRENDIAAETIQRHGEDNTNQHAMLCAAQVLMCLEKGMLTADLRSQAVKLMSMTA